MASISGTFAGTGNSEAVSGSKVAVNAVFAGAATVNVQWNVGGVWSTLESFTGSFQKVYDGPPAVIRLNCSAFTANVDYGLSSYLGVT